MLAREGVLGRKSGVRDHLDGRPFAIEELPGGHHLHLDDEAGAEAVAAVIRPFLTAD
ncbi:hypothetical protein D3C78_1565200 [compost metagenome]